MGPGQMRVVVIRGFVIFVCQLVVALVVTTAVAALWALTRGGGFVHALDVGLFVLGGVVLAFGLIGVGGVSPSSGLIGADGMTPGIRAGEWVPPDGGAVSPLAILVVTGAALIGIGIAV
jgi:hypothetical protein